MPTRKGGQRPRHQRIGPTEPPVADQPEVASDVASAEGVMPAEAAAARAPKAPRRNPLYPVGVTLFPLDAETQSWSDWYARDLEGDLASLDEARFALVRLLVSWKVLEPQVGQYSEEALERLGDIVDAAKSHRQQVIVCFFADDRHAELADVGWGKRRDPRTDQYLVQREVALVQKVVSRLRTSSGVFAWQLADEAFCSGFTTQDALESWTRQMRDAIRELDPKRPITLGADPETMYRATGVDARPAIASCEFGVTHVTAAYRAYAAEGPIESGPSTYLDSFLLRAADRGKPVLMDSVGVLSLDNSVAEEAAALRTALWSGLINGASGAMVRRLRDLDVERREPYFIEPFETLVGLTDVEGDRKPTFAETRAFVRAAARIDLRNHEASPERTAVIIPTERYNPLPDLAGLYDPRACLSAFVAAKEAHVPVTVADESDDFSEYSVLIVPSAFTLAEDTWERLTAFVQAGGVLALSYGGGDAHPGIRDLFGVEFLGDDGPRSTLSCRVAQQDVLGSLEGFDARLEMPNFALLSGGTATIVATDAKGSPLLTLNQVGQGRAVYIATPLERSIAQDDPWATPAPVRALLREVYGAIARAAGCGSPIGCDAPDVELALFQGEADDVLVLVNHAPVKVTATLTAERRIATIGDVRGGAPVGLGGLTFSAPLEPNGVAALRLTYA
jgi:endo-1,4-beta-mannosidase